MKKQMIIAMAAVAAMASGSVMAFEKGDWVFKAGLTNVDPKQDNGTVDLGDGNDLDIVVDDDTSVSLIGQYFFTDAFAIELLASLPFEHDFTVGGLAGASTQHLPPTLSLQYHFNTGGTVIPYLGLGANWTTFFSTESYGDLAGADIKLDDSFGVAAQAGIDYMFTEKLMVNLDVRYIQIESDVKVGGAKVGTAKINPVTVGLNVGYRF